VIDILMVEPPSRVAGSAESSSRTRTKRESYAKTAINNWLLSGKCGVP